ncbi:restriction endonuclease subunit S [Herbaspirillum sp.]|uniref:restriction endonuclease subunit S n=1 Tax=Herbaspirillum sp. TaxID=1890675 RepID=UPI000C09C984|nr:restriction endonuclease subunit S [Herbaspirillum sp.]MAF01922.1 hypothetical protein [Herbaspirillum sp.]MBO17978.1 hypothetical protein [Herbaspirillum sp.]|tara:strand:+ start:27947 stop:29134 length:1188 start_codon:yes stop_codon:yes gene_type:complete
MELKSAPTSAQSLPKGWDIKTIGAVCPLQRGFDLPNSKIESGTVPIVYSNGILKTHAKSMARGPGVVTGRSGTIGNVHYVEGDYWPHNTALWVTNFKGNHPKFIYYLLSCIGLEKFSSGSGVPTLNRNDVHQYKVKIPESALEQSAIASALSDVDDLLAKLDQLIAKKSDIKKGAMQELLTGKRRLPGFSQEWHSRTLYELAEKRKEFFDDGDWIEARYLTESGVRLIQTGNIGEGFFIEKEGKKYISEDTFNSLRCKELMEGDILICRLAEPAGRACLFPKIGDTRAITAVDVTIYRPQSSMANRRFLVHVFNTPDWYEVISERCGGSTRSRISRSELGKISISLPSVDEQSAIAAVLDDMDKEILALKSKREKISIIKNGMTQQLLTGKIRLV